jgi:DNA-binding NtrC family response regulator
MVIVITAHGTTDTAIDAMKYGAYDYILKEFEPTEMENLVYDALQIRKMMYETVGIEGEDQLRSLQDRIVGRSKPEVLRFIGIANRIQLIPP